MKDFPKTDRQDTKLFLWEGAALYLGQISDTTPHRHHAVQVCHGLDGEFSLVTDGTTTRTGFVTIPPNFTHQLVGGPTRLAFALIDADTIEQNPHALIFAPATSNPAPPALANPQTVSQAQVLLDQLIAPASICMKHAPRKDPRIERVLMRLKAPGTQQVSAREMAGLANLSESRFLHLFSKDTGLPLRRYVLWRRIITSIRAIITGNDLTGAAHLGGFSDSAHFTRTFRQTFGLSPSQLFKSSRNIQVFVPPD